MPVVVPVLDIDDVALTERRGIGAIQFVEDAVPLGHAGYGLYRPGHARHRCRAGKAEQPGQEQSSIHGILPICGFKSQSITNRP